MSMDDREQLIQEIIHLYRLKGKEPPNYKVLQSTPYDDLLNEYNSILRQKESNNSTLGSLMTKRDIQRLFPHAEEGEIQLILQLHRP